MEETSNLQKCRKTQIEVLKDVERNCQSLSEQLHDSTGYINDGRKSEQYERLRDAARYVEDRIQSLENITRNYSKQHSEIKSSFDTVSPFAL